VVDVKVRTEDAIIGGARRTTRSRRRWSRRSCAGGISLGRQPPLQLLDEARAFVAQGYTARKPPKSTRHRSPLSGPPWCDAHRHGVA